MIHQYCLHISHKSSLLSLSVMPSRWQPSSPDQLSSQPIWMCKYLVLFEYRQLHHHLNSIYVCVVFEIVPLLLFYTMSITYCQYTIKINLILFHCKEFQYSLLCIKDNKRESGILFNLKVNNLLIQIQRNMYSYCFIFHRHWFQVYKK